MRSRGLILGADRGEGNIKKPPGQLTPCGSPCRHRPASAIALGRVSKTPSSGPLAALGMPLLWDAEVDCA